MFEKLKGLSVEPWSCEFEVVHEDWLFKLLHFKGERKHKIPLLFVYAFINRPYILDLHEEVSVVKKLLAEGIDVWMIDWGYPKRADKFVKIADYIDYIDFCVDKIRKEAKVEAITLHGYCLGSTLAVIYSALFPEKVKNLVIQTPPINFDTENALALWAKHLDARKISRAMGNVSGEMLNIAFLLVDPIRLVLGKYQGLLDNAENERFLKEFFHMDFWIFDSPAVPGSVFEEFIERWYHKNELIENRYDINGRKVDLSKITMPVLALYAEKDHITPPSSVIPFLEKIPSKDKKAMSVDKGHIGLTVSKSAHVKLWKEAIKWIVERSD
ncbi:MAG: alpha/beta fold hydrolase [Archaeoglobaceae archaeon]|uniref:Alpha/beta fold hydrolase n=1 Tax=Archaeoglobus fulgidus TaxID=2234 RepID=A0A7J3M1V2_ARCFL